MATSSSTPANPPSSSPAEGIPQETKPDVTIRKPLKAFQEDQVQDIYHKRVRARCSDAIRAFAECATGRTVTAAWVCRDLRLAMNTCMLAHATKEEEDLAREEWYATRDQRRREREEERRGVEARRQEVIQMMREDEERRRKEKEARKAQQGSWFGWGSK